MSKANSLREERLARALDREIAPVFHDRFATLLWRHLPVAHDLLVLDVHAGSGRTTCELLERLPESCRVVALEPSVLSRGLAKTRVPPEWKNRVYVKPGDLSDVADMPDATYDVVIANLVLSEAHDRKEALHGMARVLKPGGTLLATVPMEGSWTEAEDLFREVLLDAGLAQATARLRRLANLRPSGQELAAAVRELGVGAEHLIVEQERFSLLFRSGREFLFSPLVEFGPLRLWKAIIGNEGDPQELFFRFKESIDSYFRTQVFSVTIVAGIVVMRRPQRGLAGARAVAETTGEYWRQFPELDALFGTGEGGSVLDEDISIEIDVESEVAASASATRNLLDRRGADTALEDLLDQVLEFDGPPRAADALVPRARRSSVPTLKGVKAVMPDAPRPGPPRRR